MNLVFRNEQMAPNHLIPGREDWANNRKIIVNVWDAMWVTRKLAKMQNFTGAFI